MGRFTAWMASRRKTQRCTKGARGGRAARSLGFERCEQRLALSTSTGYEPVPVHLQGLDGAEGGFIVLTSGAGFTVLTGEAGIVRAFSSGNSAADHWTWLNANDSSNAYLYNSGATQIVAANGLNDYFSPRLLGANVNFQSNSGWTGSFDSFGDLDFGVPGVLVTESNVCRFLRRQVNTAATRAARSR
jgi:hypothetical protein